MLFNSIQFLFFFPLVTVLYFLCPFAWRWLLLLIASCYFYMVLIPAYILILFVLILVDYCAALWMERHAGGRRKAILVLSLLANVGMLGLFKYFDFFNANLLQLARWLGWHYPVHNLSLLLPIGLSFHTFQSMSYTIEVYRGRQKPERHLGIYALYVMFYPQLVAGPIERPQNLLHQFRREHTIDWSRIEAGLKLMLVGLFKKVAVADTLAITVNTVYRDPGHFSSASLLVAIYFFAFQILYDFSGYSDIARGAAKVMGFDLMVNFDRPYAARTIAEFWKRWHISLSSWFRDYLYIPLGGNRLGQLAYYRNLLVVFLVSGLWHGANWTFVAWGAVHGIGLVLSAMTAEASGPRTFARNILSTVLTFHYVVFSWVFFRAATIAQSLDIIRGLFRRYQWSAIGKEVGSDLVLISALLVAGTELALWIQNRGVPLAIAPKNTLIRKSLSYAWALALIAMIIVRATYDSTPQQFIYFQF